MKTELTEEQKDHFSSERNHWCIVQYTGSHTPFYYAGYFGKRLGQEMKPAFTLDFNGALKLHSKIAAEELLRELMRHVPELFGACKVEDHRWM
jgi:hypothetical protein